MLLLRRLRLLLQLWMRQRLARRAAHGLGEVWLPSNDQCTAGVAA